ncbi:MAG: sugar nucleotide-binding protein, partial [Actinomycetota bacterium]
ARDTHAVGVANLAEACAEVGARLCTFSSDYVFGDGSGTPYTEVDETGPLSVYGRTKVDSEHAAGPDALVVRTAWMSGRTGRNIV